MEIKDEIGIFYLSICKRNNTKQRENLLNRWKSADKLGKTADKLGKIKYIEFKRNIWLTWNTLLYKSINKQTTKPIWNEIKAIKEQW